MNSIKQFFNIPAIISALPNTISNGQTADAVPLMADLNHIVNQVNANAADATLVPLLAAANTFTEVQSGVSATSSANFPTAGQVQDSVFLTLTSTLGTNTITARCAALTLGALADGQIFTFIPSQNNTGVTTLNPGPGAAAVFLGGTNVTSGQIIKDVPVAVRYQSPVFHMLTNPFAYKQEAVNVTFTASSSGTITIDAAFNALTYVKGVKELFFHGTLKVGSVSSPVGVMRIAGLPVACINSDNSESAVSIHSTGWTGSVLSPVTGKVEKGTTTIALYWFSAGVQQNIASYAQAGTEITISGHYPI